MRVLAIAAFSFSAAAFASVYLLPFRALLLAAGVCALAGGALLLARRRWLRPAVLALLSLAFGFGWFYLHDLRTLIPCRLLDGETRWLSVRVLDYPEVYDEYCRLTVRIEDEGLPRVDAIVYDSGKSLAGAAPGQRCRFRAKLSSADRRYGERYDAWLARDVYLTMNTRSDAVTLKEAKAWDRLPVRIQKAVTGMIRRIFPQDAAAFMRALMLGDKTELYQERGQYVALSRAGNMHATAVSGLHIAFLVGLIQLLLGRQRFSSLLCIALVWCFVLITGASPSALRAAVMQSVLLLAPILRRENDPPTTLAFALGLILLRNPRAAASVSLQLSFAAMAGLLCFGEGLYGWLTGPLPKGRLRKLLSGPAAAVSSSLAVLPFTVPLTAIHFGYVPLLSPITGVLCWLPISMCFCGGYLSCLLGLIFRPLGIAGAWLVSWLVRYILLASRAVSSLPFAVVYIGSVWSVLWIVGVYLLFLLARFLPLKRGEKLLLPAALALLSLLLLMNLTRLRYERSDGYLSVLDVGQGQCLCAFAGDQTLMIDCGGVHTAENAGETAGRFLISHGRERVDALVLTHLDSDHINGLPMLLELLPVRMLILPDTEEAESDTWREILDAARAKGTELIPLREDSVLSFSRMQTLLYRSPGEGGANDSGLFVRVSIGDYDMLVTGDASQETERLFLSRALPTDTELLIAGHHGSKYASGEELLRFCGADTAVISVGYNTYGHPAEETLERLAQNGYTVYRTDLDGTLIFRIEDGHGKKER